MNAKVEKESASSALDVSKLLLAGVLLAAGIGAYYYFDWIVWARIGVLMVGLLAAAAVAAFTGPGRAIRDYLTESQFELRKVVWPTRNETLRTTLVIIAVVAILSILLGVIDLILRWAVLDHLLKVGG